ncbi:MAG: glycosyltransferase, partial [bacterium]
DDRIHFLGFRTDIKELYKIADLFLLTSLQEGLPRSMMEAMAAGLPVIASRIRGNVDLVRDGEGGFLFGTGDVAGYAKAIRRLGKDETLRASMGQKNLVNIRKYDSAVVEKEILHIYRETLGKA